MRKILIISVLFLSFSGKAQMWFANGAEWYYYFNHYSTAGCSSNGHHKITVTNSLTIAGDTCYELTRTFTGISPWPTNPPVYNSYRGQFIVKVKDDVLSVCTNSTLPSFDTLCDFKATVGTKWKTLIDYSCSSNSVSTEVTSTGTTSINGVTLRQSVVTSTIKASVLGGNTYTYISSNTYVEKLAGLTSFYFRNCCNVDCCPNYGGLSCYQDNNFGLYKVPGYTLACNYSPVGFKENSYQTADVSIYPQPANQIVNLSSPLFSNKSAQIQLSNNLGQLCFKQNVKFNNGNVQIPLGDLPKGIYILKLIDVDLKTFTQKLIVE